MHYSKRYSVAEAFAIEAFATFSDMPIVLTTEAKRQLLQAAVDHVRNKAELGRMLGYRDGAFVGQMLKGIRPITEKTILQLTSLHALKPIFATFGVDAPQGVGEAHLPSLNEFDHLPFVVREKLMEPGHKVSGIFKTEMPDDALKDQIPKGTVLVFEAGTDVAPGRVVLVEGRDGKRFVRKYAEGRNGEWRAIATNKTHADLDGALDELKIIAVLRWIAAE